MPDVVMPKLSESMEQGTILTWLKASGDNVQIGDEILEIETDKSTVTHVAEDAGTLETLVPEGSTVAVGVLIARIGSEMVGVAAASPPQPVDAVTEMTANGESSTISLPAATAGPGTRNSGCVGGRLSATPLARRTAAVHGVELDGIQGTGPLGRITRADVLEVAGVASRDASPLPTSRGNDARRASPAAAPAAPMPASTVPVSEGSSRREPSRLQQLIARRMAEAKATVPHFQVQTEAAMDAAIKLRAELRALTGEGDPVPSLNDIIIKAAAMALRDYPIANGSYQNEGFVLHDRVNVGMAVAAADALVVPTVFDADVKSLRQIAGETRLLAGRVRNGEISPAELDGGTFTVSNLGMFGMTAITPVINPPQAAILGVGALRETLVRVDGEIADRTLMTLTMSCDHRILYGADASRFLARIRELLETPISLGF